MKKYTLSIFILFLLIQGIPLTARAQVGGNVVDQLRSYLDTNQDILERARDAVRAAHNPVAERLLVQAADLQEKALNLFSQQHYLLALSVARQARQKAKDALAVARQVNRSDAVVLRKLEQAGEHLQKAHELLSNVDRRDVRVLVQTAKQNLDRAWEFYRNGQYRPALKLADQVEDVSRRILVTYQAFQTGQRQFDQRVEQVHTLLERADAVVSDCNSEQAEQVLSQARESFDRAERFAQQQHPRAALNALKTAYSLATKAIRQCRGKGNLETRYEHLRSQMELLYDQLGGSGGSNRVSKLMEQAGDQLKSARKYIDDKQTKRAAAALQAAQLALRQVKRYIEQGN